MVRVSTAEEVKATVYAFHAVLEKLLRTAIEFVRDINISYVKNIVHQGGGTFNSNNTVLHRALVLVTRDNPNWSNICRLHVQSLTEIHTISFPPNRPQKTRIVKHRVPFNSGHQSIIRTVGSLRSDFAAWYQQQVAAQQTAFAAHQAASPAQQAASVAQLSAKDTTTRASAPSRTRRNGK